MVVDPNEARTERSVTYDVEIRKRAKWPAVVWEERFLGKFEFQNDVSYDRTITLDWNNFANIFNLLPGSVRTRL